MVLNSFQHVINISQIHISWFYLLYLQSLLLRTFSFSAISTYNSYLPLIFGTNALVWGYFWNVRKGRFWGHWGQRTIDVEFWGCDLKIWQPFLKISANLEKGRQTSVWETVPTFWFISLWYLSFCITYKSSLWGTIKKSNKSERWNRFSYRGLPSFFEVGSQLFRNDSQISRLQPQNLISIVLWPQWTKKRPLLYISKIAPNQCICSKD